MGGGRRAEVGHRKRHHCRVVALKDETLVFPVEGYCHADGEISGELAH